MTTSYQITSRNGQHLATVDTIAAAGRIVTDNPGAEVRAVVTVADRCATHPAFESSNCPACGTAQRVG